jgi:hypothetical protein
MRYALCEASLTIWIHTAGSTPGPTSSMLLCRQPRKSIARAGSLLQPMRKRTPLRSPSTPTAAPCSLKPELSPRLSVGEARPPPAPLQPPPSPPCAALCCPQASLLLLLLLPPPPTASSLPCGHSGSARCCCHGSRMHRPARTVWMW